MEPDKPAGVLVTPKTATEIRYRRVLCFVDSTERADCVVAVAKAFVATCDGKCHVVMGLDCPDRSRRAVSVGRGANLPLTPQLIAETESRLAALYGDGVSAMVLPGHPLVEICRYARTQNMDLIAIGNQGLAVERVYGQELRESAPCPILTLYIPESTTDVPVDLRGA